MHKLNFNRSMVRFALSVSVITLLSACGGGGAGDDLQQPLSDATVQGITAAPISADPSTTDFVPTPGNGLDIAYEDPGVALDSSNEFIVTQWLHMQNCLQVSAVEPVVSVVEGKLIPVTTNDDVVRHIDGQIQASSSISDTGTAIQVRSADFDGSLGEPGLYLRSIMGRYLWLANGLAERDYPYECANES